jgi:hypothetical protein
MARRRGGEQDLMMLTGWKSREMLARYRASSAAERARDAHHRLSPVERLLGPSDVGTDPLGVTGHPSDRLVRRSPSGVHGGPGCPYGYGTAGFRFHWSPPPYTPVQREWLPTWLPARALPAMRQQRHWFPRRPKYGAEGLAGGAECMICRLCAAGQHPRSGQLSDDRGPDRRCQHVHYRVVNAFGRALLHMRHPRIG